MKTNGINFKMSLLKIKIIYISKINKIKVQKNYMNYISFILKYMQDIK